MKDIAGTTPLLIACRHGHTGVVQELLDNGADANIPNKDGDTPLLIASRHGDTNIVKALLASDADFTVTGKDGDTSLHFACRHGHTDVVQLLLNITCVMQRCVASIVWHLNVRPPCEE
jgi:ankyrin repeat protein